LLITDATLIFFAADAYAVAITLMPLLFTRLRLCYAMLPIDYAITPLISPPLLATPMPLRHCYG